MDDAACLGLDMFPRDEKAIAVAKRVCLRCPVRSECLTYAHWVGTDIGSLYGVWAGWTAREIQEARA